MVSHVKTHANLHFVCPQANCQTRERLNNNEILMYLNKIYFSRSNQLIEVHLARDHLIPPDDTYNSKGTKKFILNIEPSQSTTHAIEESLSRSESKTLPPKKRFAQLNARERTKVKKQIVYDPFSSSKNESKIFHTHLSEQLLRATVKKVKLFIRQLHSIDVDFKDFPREKITLKSGVKVCICFFCRVDIYDYSVHTDLIVSNEPFSGARILHDKAIQTGLDTFCCIEKSVKHSLDLTTQ